MDVAINYVGRPQGAEETKDQIRHGIDLCMKQLSAASTNPIVVEADVSDAAAVNQMFDQMLDAYGRIGILINNAGIQVAGDTEELAVGDLHRVLAVNPHGAFLCAPRGVRALRDLRRLPVPGQQKR